MRKKKIKKEEVKENVKPEDIEEVVTKIEDAVEPDDAILDEEVEETVMEQTKDVS